MLSKMIALPLLALALSAAAAQASTTWTCADDPRPYHNNLPRDNYPVELCYDGLYHNNVCSVIVVEDGADCGKCMDRSYHNNGCLNWVSQQD
jgi:hypothetical protein